MTLVGLPAVSELQVEGTLFPATVRPPGSPNTLFLAGAGVRGLDIDGVFVKFTAIGVYLGGAAVHSLAAKWRGETAEELAGSLDFFLDVVTGPYEKLTNVTLISTLTGEQYSDKVAENCVAIWKAAGTYTDAEVEAMEKFKAAFRGRVFPPGSSILLAESSSGTLTIAFSTDGTVPSEGDAVIESRAMAEAFLESVIGQNGVSPAAKRSLAARISELLREHGGAEEGQAEEV